MRLKGRITNWQDDRGFGFVEPMSDGVRTFAHISAFTRKGRRPADGDIVTYELTHDGKGRPRASNIAWSDVGMPNPVGRRQRLAQVFAFLFIVALGLAGITGGIPVHFPVIYTVMSMVTFFVYAWDKHAAKSDGWRTQESTLHALALAGGWPGALIAQSRLRHKSRKRSFQIVFWMTVLANCGSLAWLLGSPERRDALLAIFNW